MNYLSKPRRLATNAIFRTEPKMRSIVLCSTYYISRYESILTRIIVHANLQYVSADAAQDAVAHTNYVNFNYND